MKLIANVVISHRNKAGQQYDVKVGESFEIADAAGEILLAAREAKKPEAPKPDPKDPPKDPPAK